MVVMVVQVVMAEDGIKEAGDLFMHIMLSSRHRGALEKSYLGFQLLSENLLSCAHPGLYSLPGTWIQVPLLHHTTHDRTHTTAHTTRHNTTHTHTHTQHTLITFRREWCCGCGCAALAEGD